MNLKRFILEKLKTQKVDNWHGLLEKDEYLKIAVDLLNEIEKLGGEALIVGGAIRDLLIGKIPKDIDLCTNVPMDVLEKNFHTNDIGASKDFGILTIQFKEYNFEVAQYRSENFSDSSDNRKPDSVNLEKSFEKDSDRRDITFNALGLTKEGVIIDYQNGIEDLNNKIVRTVGDAKERFKEDALRIVRILRFAARLGFEIEENTKQAVIELKDLLENISPERIRDELYKSAHSGESLAKFIEHLDDTGILERFLPEVSALKNKLHFHLHHPEGAYVHKKGQSFKNKKELEPFNIENPEHQDPEKHIVIQGDAYDHTLAAVRASKETDPVHLLAILFHDLGKATTHKVEGDKHSYHGHENELYLVDNICDRLKISNKDRSALKFAMEHHMKGHKIQELNKNKVLAIRQDPNWPYLKSTLFADDASRGRPLFKPDEFQAKLDYIENLYDKFGATKQFEDRMATLIDGKLIMKVIPTIKGKDIGRIKDAVRQWIVDNDFNVTPEDVKIKILSLQA